MRFLSLRRTKRPNLEWARSDSLRLLMEYVVHMSLTCLGELDVTPLYDEYIPDPRLGDVEKAELTEAYRSLRPKARVAATT